MEILKKLRRESRTTVAGTGDAARGARRPFPAVDGGGRGNAWRIATPRTTG
jgi:hypothetical protein